MDQHDEVEPAAGSRYIVGAGEDRGPDVPQIKDPEAGSPNREGLKGSFTAPSTDWAGRALPR